MQTYPLLTADLLSLMADWQTLREVNLANKLIFNDQAVLDLTTYQNIVLETSV